MLAALLFGVSTPLATLLLPQVSPMLMASQRIQRESDDAENADRENHLKQAVALDSNARFHMSEARIVLIENE